MFFPFPDSCKAIGVLTSQWCGSGSAFRSACGGAGAGAAAGSAFSCWCGWQVLVLSGVYTGVMSIFDIVLSCVFYLMQKNPSHLQNISKRFLGPRCC